MIHSKGQWCLLDNIEAMFYLAVVNLLAHNNIAIIYYVQENSQTPLGVPFILLLMVPTWNI